MILRNSVAKLARIALWLGSATTNAAPSFAGSLLSLLILGFKQRAGPDGRAAGESLESPDFVPQLLDFGGLFLEQTDQQQDQPIGRSHADG